MKTVTGLFDNYDDANDAVGELVATGVPRDDISIVANNATGWHKDEKRPKPARTRPLALAWAPSLAAPAAWQQASA